MAPEVRIAGLFVRILKPVARLQEHASSLYSLTNLPERGAPKRASQDSA